MPLPLTVSCFSKNQIGFTFLVPAHLGSPWKRMVCVSVLCHVPVIWCTHLYVIVDVDHCRLMSCQQLSTKLVVMTTVLLCWPRYVAWCMCFAEVSLLPNHFLGELLAPLPFGCVPSPVSEQNIWDNWCRPFYKPNSLCVTQLTVLKHWHNSECWSQPRKISHWCYPFSIHHLTSEPRGLASLSQFSYINTLKSVWV